MGLTYANVIWHPTKIKDITAVENVQRRATKYLPSLKDLSQDLKIIFFVLILKNINDKQM